MLIVRIFVTLLAAFATYLFMYWVPFSLILPSGQLPWLPTLGSSICAYLVARYVWKHSGSVAPGFVRSVLLGAFATGGIGFTAGFLGPMILTPDANQGPLLGIFITGPLGFLLGGVGGSVHWLTRGKRRARAGDADD